MNGVVHWQDCPDDSTRLFSKGVAYMGVKVQNVHVDPVTSQVNLEHVPRRAMFVP